MGDYYNTTRGPLSVTLNDGSAASVVPKKWFYVTPANEGSSSIMKLVEKGFLVRAKVAITPEPAAVVAASTAAVATAAAVASEKSEAPPVPAASAPSKGYGGKNR